ncbi:MAG: transposase [Steroidobacteraceae bacterium]
MAAFDGGTVSSDAGALLLGKADEAIGLIDRLAGCFIDGRDPDLIEHTVRTLIGQRVWDGAAGA